MHAAPTAPPPPTGANSTTPQAPTVNTYLETPSMKITLPRLDGKIIEKELTELFGTDLDVDMNYWWKRRALPTAETPVECSKMKTCNLKQVRKVLDLDVARSAFSRTQLVAFAKQNNKLIPDGGDSGAWMLYWEADQLTWGYIYRRTSAILGFVPYPFDYDEVLHAHHKHLLVLRERR